MRLTKNEQKALKLLLNNAKISDSTIANNLKISSQAVGKIRKKLENTVIDSYTLKLNYYRLGIQVFAISFTKITPEGIEIGEEEIEKKLLENPHVIKIYRISNGTPQHIILYGFRDLNELDSFFNSNKKRKEIHRFIENKNLFTFSHNNLLKDDSTQLFQEVINNLGTSELNGILERKNFRKKFYY